MKEEDVEKAILTLEVLIDCNKEDGTYYNAQKEWEALEVFKKLHSNWKEFKKWLEYKAEQMDEFDIPKRKETRAFWFSTRGEIQGFLDKMQEIESGKED